MSDGEAVVVAVRCRPFNKRETELGSKLIVRMQGPKTFLTSPQDGKVRDFTFDYSYWSHNKSDANFVDNPRVFKDIGISVLDNMYKGFNVCLFAYGQTGAGKSYSMVGYGDDRGIVPMAMEEIFKRVDANKDPHVKYLVEGSMFEIYNEKVRDLFNPKHNPPEGLKVRDHPTLGPYVDGLTRVVVTHYQQIQELMDAGTAARSVASTAMNATSSRAHTVFQIVLTSTTHDVDSGKDAQKVSRVNLIDLAGSERVSKTGAAGDTLKEGIGINKSLTALGDCIEKLAKASNDPKGKVHVPYRNSTLTWLLKQSLGGNSKTIMIAAISPADDNFDESLSTLRYADRAKQIKNKAVVNEDENAKMIRTLKEEIQRLKDMLSNGGGGGGGGMGAPSAGPGSGVVMSEKEKEELAALKEQMAQSEKLMQELNMSWEEKMKASQSALALESKVLGGELLERRRTVPHLVNLHKDPMLSECIFSFFPPDKQVRFVRKTVQPPPSEDDIVLGGMQFLDNHATAINQQGTVTLQPATAGARVFVNGQLVREATVLHHDDRVLLGAHLFFRFVDPGQVHLSEDGKERKSEIDYEFAAKEQSSSAMAALLDDEDRKKQEAEARRKEEEAERKMQAIMQQVEEEKRQQERDQKRKQQEFERQLKDMERQRTEELRKAREQLANAAQEEEAEMKRRMAEMQRHLENERRRAEEAHRAFLDEQKARQAHLEAELEKQRQEADKLRKRASSQKAMQAQLEEDLLRLIPLVNEATLIADELKQPLTFSIQLIARKNHQEDFIESQVARCRVVDLEQDTEATWDPTELQDMLAAMRDIYERWLDTRQLVLPPGDENPFVVRALGPQLLGSAVVFLQPLYFLLPVNEETPVFDHKGQQQGRLLVDLAVIPATMDDTHTDFKEDDLSQLKGERVKVWLKIPQVVDLPRRFSANVFVQYRFLSDERDVRSSPFQGASTSPKIDYERKLVVDAVSDDLIEYCKKGALEIQVFGEQPVSSVRKSGSDDQLTEDEKRMDLIRRAYNRLSALLGPHLTAAAAAAASASTPSQKAKKEKKDRSARRRSVNFADQEEQGHTDRQAGDEQEQGQEEKDGDGQEEEGGLALDTDRSSASVPPGPGQSPGARDREADLPEALVKQVEELLAAKTALEREQQALRAQAHQAARLQQEKAELEQRLRDHAAHKDRDRDRERERDTPRDKDSARRDKDKRRDREKEKDKEEKEEKEPATGRSSVGGGSGVEELQRRVDELVKDSEAERKRRKKAEKEAARAKKLEEDIQAKEQVAQDLQRQLDSVKGKFESATGKEDMQALQNELKERDEELARLRAELEAAKQKSTACLIL